MDELKQKFFIAAWQGNVFSLKAAIEEEGIAVDSTVGKIHENAGRDIYQGYTAAMITAGRKNLDCLKYLIDQGADINFQASEAESYRNMSTALIHAVDKSSIECVKYLVEQGADVNLVGEHQRSALIMACVNFDDDNLPIVETLLTQSVAVNQQNKIGNTALMQLIRSAEKTTTRGELAAAILLIEKGADLSIKNNEGQTALDMAYANQNQELSDLIRSYQERHQLNALMDKSQSRATENLSF